jgi:hypothetical protein
MKVLYTVNSQRESICKTLSSQAHITYIYRQHRRSINGVVFLRHSSDIKTTLSVTWNNGSHCNFPAIWLRLLGPIVAKHEDAAEAKRSGIPVLPPGWLANDLIMPEISYEKILRGNLTGAEFNSSKS